MNKSSGCIVKVITVFLFAFVGLVALSVWILSLEVRGKEFSPDDFTLHSFSYTRTTVFFDAYNLKRTTDQTIGMSLASSGLIKTAPPTTFHLVQDNKTDPLSRKMQASILVEYLKFNSGYWENWNSKNPKLAATLWPIIQAMAYDRLYVLTPDVFQLAFHKTDQGTVAIDFESSIRGLIVLELSKMIEEKEYESNQEFAQWYRELKAKYDPKAGPISITPLQSPMDGDEDRPTN